VAADPSNFGVQQVFSQWIQISVFLQRIQIFLPRKPTMAKLDLFLNQQPQAAKANMYKLNKYRADVLLPSPSLWTISWSITDETVKCL
jgi:hypothetical protein